MSAASSPQLPLWGKDVVDDQDAGGLSGAEGGPNGQISQRAVGRSHTDKVRFREIAKLFKVWGKGKGRRFIERVAKKLPEGLRAKVLEAELRRMERQE